jgi:ubiquinone biosynthesis protein
MLIGVSIRLPRTVRSIRRVQQIARVLSRHGFGHIVDRLALRGYVPIPRFRPVPTTAAESEQASLGQRLARAFEELGPTFIKLGQLISSRPDVFPPDIVEAMIHLQDQVPPFDTATARKIIEADLGRPLEACFSHFDEVPFASGSIAQVYRATIRPRGGRDAFSLTPHCSGAGGQAAGEQDARPSEAGSATPGRKVHPAGQRVVVKVRRPEIEDVIRLDMTILRWLAELAERVIPEWINYQPVTVVEEFERTILREMDFINEGATVTRFAEAYGYDPAFRIPVVHWELSGPAVLTLEELPGVSVQALINNPDPLVNHKLLAERLALAFVRQYFQIGMFHADPHPGNLLITPPANIGLIDFGLTGRVDDEMLGYLVVGLVGAFNREAELIVEVLAEMNALGDDTDRRQLRRGLLELIDKYYGLPLHRFNPQTMLYEITGLMRQHNVTLPREFVMLAKSLVGVGGICLQLDPDLDLLALVGPRLRGIMARRLTPRRLLRSTGLAGWHLTNLLKSAPGQLRDVARRLALGKWQVNIRHQNLDHLATEIDRSSNRLSFAMIIAAVIVGSSMILSTPGTVKFADLELPLRVFGIVGYIVAGLMGMGLAVSIWRSGRL